MDVQADKNNRTFDAGYRIGFEEGFKQGLIRLPGDSEYIIESEWLGKVTIKIKREGDGNEK